MKRILAFAALLSIIGSAASADPLTAGLASYIATTFGVSSVAAASIAGVLIRFGGLVALNAISGALQKKQTGGGGIRSQSTTSGDETPQSFILGTYATAGNLSAPLMSHGVNGDTRYLTMVLDWSDIEVDSLLYYIVDGKKHTMSGATHADYGPTSDQTDYAGYFWHKFYDGSQTTADAMLVSKYGSLGERPWSSSMIGRGVSYSALTFLYRNDPKIWNGIPQVKAVLQGIKLYDPRLDTTVGGSGSHRLDDQSTWEFSENPFVMIYNILLGIPLLDGSVYGGGFEQDDLPLTDFTAAMNVCDEVVTNDDSSTQPRYIAGYEVRIATPDDGGDLPLDVIGALLQACAGEIAEVGGSVYARAGEPPLPSLFITDDDILRNQGQSFDPFPTLAQTFNGVHATYPNPDELWATKEAPERYDTAAIAEDGDQNLIANLTLPAVPDDLQVQRLMEAWLRTARQFRRHNIPLPPIGSTLRPLETIDWTSDRNGYSNKLFEIGETIMSWRSLATGLAVIEADPDDYDWVAGDDELQAPVSSATPEVVVVQTVPGWAFAGVEIQDSGSTARRPGLKGSYTPSLPGVTGISWELRVSGQTAATQSGTVANIDQGYFVIAEGIIAGESYEGRARLIGPSKTEWTAWTAATAPNTLLGPDDFVTEVNDILDQSGALPTIDTTTVDGEVDGEYAIDETDGSIYIWDEAAQEWVKAVELIDMTGAINVADFATGIAVPTLVSDLNTDGTYDGQQVVLTTDNPPKLYTWDATNSVWTAEVQAQDLVGEIVAEQIAAGAVETAAFAQGLAPIYVIENSVEPYVTPLPWDIDQTGQHFTRDDEGTPEAASAVDSQDWTLASDVDEGWVVQGAVGTVEPIFTRKTLPAIDGHTYRITVKAKVTGTTTGPHWTFRAKGLDASYVEVEEENGDDETLTSSYVVYSDEFTASSPTATQYRGGGFMRGDSTGTGTVHIAEIVFEDLTANIGVTANNRDENKLYEFDSTFTWVPITTDATYIDGEIVAAQIADGAVEVAKFAAGIQPVGIGATLPGSGSYVGEMFLLTTDRQTYTWDGSDWETGIPVDNIIGEIDTQHIADAAITAAEIAADAVTAVQIATDAVTSDAILAGSIEASAFASGIAPVETLASLPSTGNFAGRMVFLTSDEKLYRHTGTPTDETGFTVEVDGVDIVANSITAGQIAAGAIGADEIAAQAITSKHIFIGDTTNMVPSNIWRDGVLYSQWSQDSSHSVQARDTGHAANAIATMPAPYAIRAASTSADETSTYDLRPQPPVTEGDEFRIFFDAAGIASSISREWKVRLNWLDVDDADIFTDLQEVEITSTSWATFSAVTIAPTNAVAIDRLVLRAQGTSDGGSANDIMITNVRVNRMNAGSLIVDGSIVAAHLAVDSVDATKIVAASITGTEIAASTITGGNIAAETIVAGNIAASTITGDKVAANTIEAANIAAATITVNEMAANSIDTAQLIADSVTTAIIAAGAVTATEVAAGAITTTKLAVTDFNNYVPTDLFLSGDTDGWSLNSEHTVVARDTGSGDPAIANMPTPYALVSSTSGSTETSTISFNNFSVKGGDQFRITGSVAGKGTGIDREWRFRVNFEDNEGTQLNPSLIDVNVTSTSWSDFSGVCTAPSNAVFAKEAIVRSQDPSTGSVNEIYVTAIEVHRMNAGELIVDGSIIADYLAADSVDASKIVAASITGDEIAANSIDTGHLVADSVTSAIIAADAVTANEIAADAINATHIAADAITADAIAANAIETQHISADAVTADEIAANAINATHLSADSVEAAAISAGAVGADQVAANAIAVKHLAVVDFTNLCPMGDFSTGDFEGWDNSDIGYSVEAVDDTNGANAVATMPAPFALKADAIGRLVDRDLDADEASGFVPFNINDSEQLAVQFDYAGSGSSINRDWSVLVYFHGRDNAFLASRTITQTVSSTVWATKTHVIDDVPTGATKVYLIRIRAEAGGSNNDIYLANLKTWRMNGASLIVDGTIQANHIVAGGIDAIDIIADGTITATQINAGGIDAEDIISTGTITGSLIQALTITGDKIVADTIQASKIKIDGITLDTDGDDLIISDNGVDFTQLAANSATKVRFKNQSWGTGSSTRTWSPSLTADHTSTAVFYVRVKCTAVDSGDASDAVTFELRDGTTVLDSIDSTPGDAESGVVLLGTDAKASGTSTDHNVHLTSLPTSSSWDVDMVVWYRYR